MMESCRINEDDEELHVHRNLRQSRGLSQRTNMLRSPAKLNESLVAAGMNKHNQDKDRPYSNQAINAAGKKQQEDISPSSEMVGGAADLSKTEERPSSAIQEEQPNRLALDFMQRQAKDDQVVTPNIPSIKNSKERIKRALADFKQAKTGPYDLNVNGVCASNRHLLLMETLAMEAELQNAI